MLGQDPARLTMAAAEDVVLAAQIRDAVPGYKEWCAVFKGPTESTLPAWRQGL